MPQDKCRLQLACGESRSLDVAFAGVPRPLLECSVDGQALDSERVRVELLERLARFSIRYLKLRSEASILESSYSRLHDTFRIHMYSQSYTRIVCLLVPYTCTFTQYSITKPQY